MKEALRTADPPDVLQHVENLGGQVGVGHVKLRQVGLQHRGRRLLGLQRGDLLLEAQDPGHTDRRL